MADLPHVAIIGGGFTGCALAYDLALRGFGVTLFERGELASGTSGRTHGLLHSGARYCVNDQESAKECIQENIILRRIAKQSIEFNGGLFIALDESDLAYAPAFVKGATECGIPVEQLTPRQVLGLEPRVNPAILDAYSVPDGSFDPLRLALCFASSAKALGAVFKPYHEVREIQIDGQGACRGLHVLNRTAGETIDFGCDFVVNATGAWASRVLGERFTSVQVSPTPGIMVAFDHRPVNRVLNRLTLPSDGDILIPQRRMSVVGTTSYEAEDVDYIPVIKDQTQQMIREATLLVPDLKTAHLRGVYMSARPLVGFSMEGRSLARTFKCIDHHVGEGVKGLVTITGGKATTCRLMAEATADHICATLGLNIPCQTHERPLRSYRDYYRENQR